MRNLVEAAPDSSQSSSLVEANETTVAERRQQRRSQVQHIHKLEAFLLRGVRSRSCGALQRRSDGLGDIASDGVHTFVAGELLQSCVTQVC